MVSMTFAGKQPDAWPDIPVTSSSVQAISEPLPFIGDDLLISFDDERTLACLKLLAVGDRQSCFPITGMLLILAAHSKIAVLR